MQMKIKIINTTTDSYEVATNIAKILVSEKLSPCVHIIPKIESIYKWDGKIEQSVEILLIIKTIPKKVNDCKKLILRYHNYDVPELTIMNSEILLNRYKEWFNENFSES